MLFFFQHIKKQILNGIRGIVYNGQVWHNFKIVRYADYFKKIFFFNIYKNIEPKSNEKNSKRKTRKIRRKNRKNK